MTQDIQEPETFAPSAWTTLRRGPGRLWLPIVGLVCLALGLIAVVGMLSPEKQHLLFDVGTAVLAVLVVLRVLRWAVAQNLRTPHAELRSLTYGCAAAGAIFGVMLYSLHGRTIGWTQSFALVVGYALVVVVGASVGALIGALCYWPVHLLAGKLFGVDYRFEASLVGALAGFTAFAPLVFTGQAAGSLEAAGVALGALCTYRAAVLHERFTPAAGKR